MHSFRRATDSQIHVFTLPVLIIMKRYLQHFSDRLHICDQVTYGCTSMSFPALIAAGFERSFVGSSALTIIMGYMPPLNGRVYACTFPS